MADRKASPFALPAVRQASGPRAVLRVVNVLGALAAHPAGLRLPQLCLDLGLPKTTLFTMLRVLHSAGYVVNDDGQWRLGGEAMALAAAIGEGSRRAFPDCAMPSLKALSHRTRETVFLAELTPDFRRCRYVAAIDTDNWLRFSVEVGTERPAYATGSGRAMLAFLPPRDLSAALDGVKFEKLTTDTIRSRRALDAALAEVRKRGVSVVDSGTVAGVTSVAAPIFDREGRVVAAVIAGGPSARIAERGRDIEAAVRSAGEDISGLLGFRG